MVGIFRRSLSFPNKNPNHPSSHPQKPQVSHHIRSISLPCRSHPLISDIKDDINHVTTTLASTSSTQTSFNNLSNALASLIDIHQALEHILHLLPHTHTLRRHPLLVENILEDSLCFVDVYGMFQQSVMALKEELCSAQMAIRQRDYSKLVLYAKAKNKMVKEMDKLVSRIRCVTQHGMMQQLPTFASMGDAELVGVIGDVINVTASVSVALFKGMAVSFAPRKLTWTRMVKVLRKSKRVNKEKGGIEELEEHGNGVEESMENLKKKGVEEVRSVLKRMMDLESCICGIQSVSDKVYRAFISSRVALLNTLTN